MLRVARERVRGGGERGGGSGARGQGEEQQRPLTQQNSCRQPLLLHLMWLQPWFFSMRAWHCGHFLVLTSIQLAVSLSLPHLISQASSWSHATGACASLLQRKQKLMPQLQRT